MSSRIATHSFRCCGHKLLLDGTWKIHKRLIAVSILRLVVGYLFLSSLFINVVQNSDVIALWCAGSWVCWEYWQCKLSHCVFVSLQFKSKRTNFESRRHLLWQKRASWDKDCTLLQFLESYPGDQFFKPETYLDQVRLQFAGPCCGLVHWCQTADPTILHGWFISWMRSFLKIHE